MKKVAFVGSAPLNSSTEMLNKEVLWIIEQAGIVTQLVQFADENFAQHQK